MNKQNHFEEKLPDGYSVAKIIDAKNNKTGIILNILAFIPIVIAVAIFFILIPTDNLLEGIQGYTGIVHALVFYLALMAYVILHELIHGAAYKLLTGRKLTFGITLTVAYCGVPDIYVYRKASLIAMLAPFVVFIPIFSIMIWLLPLNLDKLFATFLLGMHIGGCSGDLYGAALYLFRFRDPTTLMNDTGPKQTFYVKKR